jgi:hypothetical protein
LPEGHEVRVSESRTVVVPHGFDESELGRLLAALETC